MSSKQRKLTNRQVAGIFQTIADLLEIKGEVIYKTLAYRRAANSLDELGQYVGELWREGRLTELPGVGKAIAQKIDELLSTGELAFLERLTNDVPITLIDILQVPGLGPKKVALFWRQLGITTLPELEAAARGEKLRSLTGMGAKSEAKIVAGIKALARRTGRIPLGTAWPFAQDLLVWLRTIPGVIAAEAGGSLRRMKETVGDLDLLVGAVDSAPVMNGFVNLSGVIEVLGQGKTKSSVEFDNGLPAQLWVHPPERFGTALQYATGSKKHNVRLRELALSQGLSLSEHALTREDGTEILCAHEEQVYSTLGLPWIPPELREDRGEIQIAKKGTLPTLLAGKDLQAELHTHSTWSDGSVSILEMAEAVRARGLKALAITDHSRSLGVAGGLSIEDLNNQRKEIEAARRQLGDSLILLHGSEVEVRADGSLDYPDEVLAQLDIVFASVHTSLSQPRQKITQRMLNAIHNPHVDVISHPTGRLIPNREGADLDMGAIFAAAAKTNTALEINAHPSRLDLNDVYARRAVELGIPLSINTDAHHPDQLDLIHFGVATARRGWVGPENVINAWDPQRLLTWLKS